MESEDKFTVKLIEPAFNAEHRKNTVLKFSLSNYRLAKRLLRRCEAVEWDRGYRGIATAGETPVTVAHYLGP